MSLSPHNRVLVGALALALAMLVPAVPVLAKPGNSLNAKACNTGWTSLAAANGTPFANQDECVAYGAHGGTYGVAERVFAVAFTDVNGNHSYEPATDVLIAKLLDSNGDNAVSAGDTVRMGRYPLDFAASAVGIFAVTSHVITGVDVVNPEQVDVNVDNDYHFTWGYQPGPRETFATDSTAYPRIFLQDWSTTVCAPLDVLRVGDDLSMHCGVGNDSFVDVTLNLP